MEEIALKESPGFFPEFARYWSSRSRSRSSYIPSMIRKFPVRIIHQDPKCFLEKIIQSDADMKRLNRFFRSQSISCLIGGNPVFRLEAFSPVREIRAAVLKRGGFRHMDIESGSVSRCSIRLRPRIGTPAYVQNNRNAVQSVPSASSAKKQINCAFSFFPEMNAVIIRAGPDRKMGQSAGKNFIQDKRMFRIGAEYDQIRGKIIRRGEYFDFPAGDFFIISGKLFCRYRNNSAFGLNQKLDHLFAAFFKLDTYNRYLKYTYSVKNVNSGIKKTLVFLRNSFLSPLFAGWNEERLPVFSGFVCIAQEIRVFPIERVFSVCQIYAVFCDEKSRFFSGIGLK